LRERLEQAEIEYDGEDPFRYRQLRFRDADVATHRSTRVLESADRALYVSKSTGRNRVTYAGPRLAVDGLTGPGWIPSRFRAA
jgi:hypothetical protein